MSQFPCQSPYVKYAPVSGKKINKESWSSVDSVNQVVSPELLTSKPIVSNPSHKSLNSHNPLKSFKSSKSLTVPSSVSTQAKQLL